MAKAKKADPPREPVPRTKTAAKRKAPKTAKLQTPKDVPTIDTSLAAQAAAKMLSAGLPLKTGGGAESAPRTESAMFKQLKAGLAKPHSQAMNSLLDKTHGPEPRKSTLPFQKQVGRDQTVGGDITRSGVPRRTPG